MKTFRKLWIALFLTTSIMHLDATGASRLTYYKDSKKIFDVTCLSCHGKGGLAGIPFETYQQIYPLRRAILRAVRERRMPIWLPKKGHREYRGDLSLSEQEILTMVQWIKQGAVAGDPKDAVAMPPKWGNLKGDLTLQVQSEPYLPPQEMQDEYRCFIIPWPLATDKYMLAEQTLVGNTKIAHHMISYVAKPAIAKWIQRFESGESGQGYRCFGGPLPDRMRDPEFRRKLEEEEPGIVDKLKNNIYGLSGWTPGRKISQLPAGTGIKIRPGSIIIVQMHYWVGGQYGGVDYNTKLVFKLADMVKRPIVTYNVTNQDWLASGENHSMVIPYQSTKRFKAVANLGKVAKKLRKELELSDDYDEIIIYSANIHMHSYGASGIAYLTMPDQSREVLLEIPRWDIDWQRNFYFKKPLIFTQIMADQIQISMECEYVNQGNLNPDRHTGEHGDPITIYGGYGSNDEMCMNFSKFSFRKSGTVQK